MTENEKTEPQSGSCASHGSAASVAIVALEGLARAHIAGAIALGAMKWRYNEAAAHRAEADKLCRLIAEIGKPNNQRSNPPGETV